jgi:hypothetical protein
MAETLTSYTLCEVSHFNQALGQAAAGQVDEAEKIRLIRAVSAYFETYCGRRFISSTSTHDGVALPRLKPAAPQLLILANTPVTSITTLTDYSGGTTWSEVAPGSGATGYVLENDSGVVRLIGAAFTYCGYPSVQCTYVGGYVPDTWAPAGLTAPQAAEQLKRWGYSTAAEDIRLAAAKAAAWMYRERTNNLEALLSISVGGTTETFRGWEDLQFIQQTLKRHRRLV